MKERKTGRGERKNRRNVRERDEETKGWRVGGREGRLEGRKKGSSQERSSK